MVSSPYYEPRTTGLTTRPSRRDRARVEMEAGPRGIGPTRRRSTCEKDRARAEMERERSKRDRARRKRKQRDTASEESKAKEKESHRLRKKRCIQGESRVALHLAHFLKLFRPPLCHLHHYPYTRLQRISTCIFPDILLREAYSAHAYS